MTDDNFSHNEVSIFRKAVAGTIRGTGRALADPKKALRDLSDAIAVGVEDKWSVGLVKIVKKLTEEEKLNQDWSETPGGRFFFQKMESELHSLRSDERLLEAKISMFLGLISDKFKGSSEAEAREAWRTVNDLGVQEITLLGTVYRLSENPKSEAHTLTGFKGWRALMAKESGLNYEQPVQRAETSLVSQGLIYEEGIQIHGLQNKSRITRLGHLRSRLLNRRRNATKSVS